jgi:hypothetical protein
MKPRTQPTTAPGLIPEAPAYPPIVDILATLGVPLSQRGHPNLREFVPNRFIPLAEATARGWSMYWSGDACLYGHQASRKVSNPNECTDCVRVREGKPAIYPKSRAQEFRSVTKPTKAEAAAPVIVTPAAPPELPASDQKFLAALDELRDFDAAATAVSTKRGLIEARVSSNEMFRKALTDLCERRGIAWTRTPDATAFQWTAETERQFARRFVDCGLLEQTRQELGISASDYHAHLAASSTFADAIEQSRPLARATLRERAMQDASRGNDRLARLMEADGEAGIFTDHFGNKVPYVNSEAAAQELQKILDEIDRDLHRQELLEEVCEQRTSTAAASHEDLTT